jgi:MFS family permease
MLKKLVHRLLKHRHFWREVEFDELSEIYITMMFRSLSLSLTNLFIPLYLLKLHYSLAEVVTTFLFYFVFRALLFDYLAGWLIIKIGAKHTILCSYGVLIVSTSLFLTLGDMHWPLWLLGGLCGGASSLYAIPFHVDFSKIKHKAHGGKEFAYASIMDKLGSILGPLTGGVIATLFGGQYIFLVAMLLLVIGGLPLLRTGEPFNSRAPLHLHELPFRPIKRDIYSFMAYGIELTMCGSVWPLYLGLAILASSAGYAKLGFLASISVVTSMVAAYSIGKLTDKKHGHKLLRLGATANALLYIFRPLTTTYAGALLVNIANEGATIAYKIPYTKGMYDRGDELDRQRVTYFVAMELTSSIAKMIAWLILLILTPLFSDFTVTAVGFAFGGIASLFITLERFKGLGPIKS